MTLNLALVISADARGVKPATSETRREIEQVGATARATTSAMQGHAAANDQAATAARRATEALRGQAAAERDLRAAVAQFAGVRTPINDNDYRQRAADIDAYGAALDQLRAKHVPLFAAQQALAAELGEIDRALKVGAISQEEHAAAALRAKAAFDLQAASLTRVGQASRLSSFQLQNLSFQLNDVVTMAAMGASPAQILTSQGGQILQSLQMGEGGIRGSLQAGKEMAADYAKSAMSALSGILTPLRLTAIGFAAAGVAAGAFYLLTREKALSADEALKKHVDSIRDIKAAYAYAATGIDDYNRKSLTELQSGSRSSVSELRKTLRAEQEALRGELFDVNPFSGAQSPAFSQFYQEIEAYRRSIDRGAPDSAGLIRSVEARVNGAADGSDVQAQGDEILAYAYAVQRVEQALEAQKRATRNLDDATRSALEGAARFRTDWEEFARLVPETTTEMERLDASLMAVMQHATSYSQVTAAAREYQRAVEELATSSREQLEDSNRALGLVGASAYGSRLSEIRASYQRRIEEADRTIGSPEVRSNLERARDAEIEAFRRSSVEEPTRQATIAIDAQVASIRAQTAALGQSVTAMTAAGYGQDILNGYIADGVPVTKDMEEAAAALGRRYAEVQEAAGALAIQQDLLFARAQIGLSPIERQVQSQLRSSGVDPNSAIGRELAQQMREVEAQRLAHDALLATSQQIDAQAAALETQTRSLGANTAETLAMTKAQELINSLMQQGVEITPQLAAEIDALAQRYGAVGEAAARANLQQDLAFERRQLLRSPDEQDIAARLRGAGLADDLNSAEAAAIRLNQQLERTKDTWGEIFDVADDSIDSLVDALFDGGEDIGEVLKGIGRDFARLMFDLALTNPLKNWLTGADLNTIADLGIFGSGASSGRGGGFGGVLGNLLGAQKAVASMQVQAATVVVNGSVLGGVGGIGGAGGLGRLFAPANSNDPWGTLRSVGNVDSLTTGAIAPMASGGDVAGRIWNFFRGKGLQPHQIAGILGNVKAESAFNPLAIGDGGNAFGLFQHNDRAASLFDFIGGRGNLGDVNRQLEFAWRELSTTENRALQALLSAKDVRGATAAFAGFERPSGFSWANPEGAHNFAGRLQGAEDALARFGDTAGGADISLEGLLDRAKGSFGSLSDTVMSASQTLNSFEGGLNGLVNALSNIGGGAGGTGWFSNLIGMFGSASGAAGYMASISPAATAAIAGGAVGLFDRGGYTGDGGKHDVAGVAHRGEFYFSKEATAAIGVGNLYRLHEAAKRGRGFAEGGFAADVAPLPSFGAGPSGGKGGTGMGIARSDIEAIVGAISGKLSLSANIINVDDEKRVERYLMSESGHRTLAVVNRRLGGRAA